VAKRLLVGVSAPLLGAARMGLGVLLLVAYLAITGRLGGLAAISGEAWLWILVTGGLLAGFVATWFAALRQTEATTVTGILVVAAVVTGVLSAASKGSAPDAGVVAGYLLIVSGVVLVGLMSTGLMDRFRAVRAVPDA